MDCCFALTGAHQRGEAVGLMNGENLRLKKPLLPRLHTFEQKKATKIHTLRPLTCELCFRNSSTTLPRRSAAIDTLTNSFNETSV